MGSRQSRDGRSERPSHASGICIAKQPHISINGQVAPNISIDGEPAPNISIDGEPAPNVSIDGDLMTPQKDFPSATVQPVDTLRALEGFHPTHDELIAAGYRFG